MCGESWLAIKDSLTHRPSSQGWAPDAQFHLSLCLVWCPGCDYLSFFPLCTFLASVLPTCISMYTYMYINVSTYMYVL